MGCVASAPISLSQNDWVSRMETHCGTWYGHFCHVIHRCWCSCICAVELEVHLLPFVVDLLYNMLRNKLCNTSATNRMFAANPQVVQQVQKNTSKGHNKSTTSWYVNWRHCSYSLLCDYTVCQQELSKPRLATPLHACVLVTYLLIYLGTYLFTRLLTRYVLQPLLYKLSKIVLI